MDMVIDFPGGAKVDAHFGPFTIATDQPPQGGGDGMVEKIDLEIQVPPSFPRQYHSALSRSAESVA